MSEGLHGRLFDIPADVLTFCDENPEGSPAILLLQDLAAEAEVEAQEDVREEDDALRTAENASDLLHATGSKVESGLFLVSLG